VSVPLRPGSAREAVLVHENAGQEFRAGAPIRLEPDSTNYTEAGEVARSGRA
jgi:hypothetical protein